jgi:hypothetical protein
LHLQQQWMCQLLFSLRHWIRFIPNDKAKGLILDWNPAIDIRNSLFASLHWKIRLKNLVKLCPNETELIYRSISYLF